MHFWLIRADRRDGELTLTFPATLTLFPTASLAAFAGAILLITTPTPPTFTFLLAPRAAITCLRTKRLKPALTILQRGNAAVGHSVLENLHPMCYCACRSREVRLRRFSPRKGSVSSPPGRLRSRPPLLGLPYLRPPCSTTKCATTGIRHVSPWPAPREILAPSERETNSARPESAAVRWQHGRRAGRRAAGTARRRR